MELLAGTSGYSYKAGSRVLWEKRQPRGACFAGCYTVITRIVLEPRTAEAKAELARIGARLEADSDPGVQALALWLLDSDRKRLAAEVERWRVYGLAMTTQGYGAPAHALRELGLDRLGISDKAAYRAWLRYYKV